MILDRIIFLVNQFKSDSIVLIGDLKTSPQSVQLYWNAIDELQLDDEAELMKYLASKGVKGRAYVEAKAQLLVILLDTLLVLKLKHFDTRKNLILDIRKEWMAMKVLMNQHAPLLSTTLGRKLLPIIDKYDLPELGVEVTYYLTRLHANQSTLKKFNKTKELYDKYFEEMVAMDKAEEAQLTVSLLLSSGTNTEEIIATIDVFEKEITPAVQLYNNALIKYHYTFLQVTRAQLEGKKQVIKNICQKALVFFEQHRYVYQPAFRYLYSTLLFMAIDEKDHPEAILLLESVLPYTAKYSSTWFNNRSMAFMIAIQQQDYQKAYDIYRKTVTVKAYDKLSEQEHQIWDTYKIYIYFLAEIKAITLNPSDKTFTKNRIGRFINQSTVYKKNKRDTNVPLLIVKCLILILRERRKDAHVLLVQLEKYHTKQLNKTKNYRANCLTKLIKSLYISKFKPIQFAFHIQTLLSNLESNPIQFLVQEEEIEVIPYNAIWHLFYQKLNI